MRLRLGLLLALIVVPLLEIYVIIQVGMVIGGWWTLGLLLAVGAVGSWLIRVEGRRTWRALAAAVGGGRLPDRELLDAGLVLVGGVLMLTPGFLSDIVGLFAILPPTRPIARRILTWAVGRQLVRQMEHGRAGRAGSATGPFGGHVVAGEVVDRAD